MASRPSIGVTTAVWGAYEQYIPRWVKAVESQTFKPDAIRVNVLDNPRSMGEARNQAVADCDTDWVCFMDPDDVMHPTAIEDTIPHLQTSDVVVWNFKWVGGPNDGIVQSYSNSGAANTLLSGHASMSPSPFRKAMWEKAPVLEIPFKSFPGVAWAVDTYFWIGLEKAGAIFRNIPGVQFDYMYHPDSVAHSMPQSDYQDSARFRQLLLHGIEGRQEGTRLVRVPDYCQRAAQKLSVALDVNPEHLWERAWVDLEQKIGT